MSGASPIASMKATALFMDRKSTSTSAMRSEDPGNAERSNSTWRFRKNSSSNMSTATERISDLSCSIEPFLDRLSGSSAFSSNILPENSPSGSAPIKCESLTVADRHAPYAHEVAEKIRKARNSFAMSMTSNESVSKKVRNAQLLKVQLHADCRRQRSGKQNSCSPHARQCRARRN